MAFLDIHVLQSVPPANINRDDAGSPKTAIYGAVPRLRVSSQAWKRAVRKAFEADPALAAESGTRTKRLPQLIADRLAEKRPTLAQHKDDIGKVAATALFNVDYDKRKTDRPLTEYLVFLGAAQIDEVVEALTTATADLAAAEGNPDRLKEVVGGLGLRAYAEQAHPGAVALFGRMIANDPTTNVDAACQVAHAISTHAVEHQYDYYTAVDDIAESDDETGAGMIGAIEFNSATLYRYATVDLRTLVDNLGKDIERALDTAVAFARAFATSMPTGKRNTFANNTRPDFVLLAVRDDQPISLVGAFEKPVSSAEDGLLAHSVSELMHYHADQDEAYGTGPVDTVAVYPRWLAERKVVDSQLPDPQPLPTALGQMRAALATSLETAR